MLTLIRYHLGSTVTQGVIGYDGSYLGDTLELPWKDNLDFVSCIPVGIYDIWHRIIPADDDRFKIKNGYVIENVPGRDMTMLHPANSVSQLKGCIAPGVKHGEVVYYSTLVFDKIVKAVGAQGKLHIKEGLK